MRVLFVFLRVVAGLISLSFVGLGLVSASFAIWLAWQLPGTGAEIGVLVGMAAFGALMLYVGTRVLREQSRMVLAWWTGTRRERRDSALPAARLVLR